MTRPPQDWEASYRDHDPPPWDIGRPQPAFVELAEQGRLTGDLFDAGCGTGEHALLAASSGARVSGLDLSDTAIRIANDKAVDRGLAADFIVGDILTLQLPQHSFDVVTDSGLFHSFSDEDRPRYVRVLAGLLRPGGVCYLMCFSDSQPGDWGPRRVTRRELDDAFAGGWLVESLQPSTFVLNEIFGNTTAHAWLLEVRRPTS